MRLLSQTVCLAASQLLQRITAHLPISPSAHQPDDDDDICCPYFSFYDELAGIYFSLYDDTLRGLVRAARAPHGRPLQRRVSNGYCATRWQSLAAAGRWAKLAARLAEAAPCRHRASRRKAVATSARTASAAPSSPSPDSNTPAPRPNTLPCTGLLAQSVLTPTRRSCCQ